MLQLATLSTRGASGALDLLITRAVEQHLLASSTLPKSSRTGLAVTIAVPISTIGNSALLIGAGYMIVNELALTLAGYGVKPHSRRHCRSDTPRPRKPLSARGDPRLAETRVRRKTVYAFSAKGMVPMTRRNQQGHLRPSWAAQDHQR